MGQAGRIGRRREVPQATAIGISLEFHNPNWTHAMEVCGTTSDGEAVMSITLSNTQGAQARLISRGATLTHWLVPDRDGRLDDIVLGFDDLAGYESGANQHFGCTTGRVANRTAHGKFQLEGVEYSLAINNGPHHLHGGTVQSLDKVVWQAEPFEETRGQGVVFRYNSPDGEEGYPGNLALEVRCVLSDQNALTIEYLATTDRATPVNLTNHSYFNLSGAGHPSISDHVMQIFADHYTPTDNTLIPTGEIAPVADTPLDFREPHPIGERIDELASAPAGGYDHNYVLNSQNGALALAARVTDPASGRMLKVFTTEPGIQFYSANGLGGQTGKGGKTYPRRSAFCLEAQHYPNSVNQPNFPSIILRPGETYRHTCVYQASVEL